MREFRVLIVENSRIFREAVKESLRTSIPRVIIEEAVDGREALEKVETFHPDFILMDIELPGENGLNLTREIKLAHPDIIILVITNLDIQEYREAALQYGADCFFCKSTLNPTCLRNLVTSCAKA